MLVKVGPRNLDLLIEGLRHNLKGFLPVEWIRAVGQLRDPSTDGDLIGYLEHGPNELFTYDTIRELPGIEFDDAVAWIWEHRDALRWDAKARKRIVQHDV